MVIATNYRRPYAKKGIVKTNSLSATVAKHARERALAAGLTITTFKEGRLVQEVLIEGRVVEVFSQNRE